MNNPGLQSLIDELRKKPGLDSRMESAFVQADRRFFLPQQVQKSDPYINRPIPIGYGQTNSQPYTVAFMLHLLDVHPGMSVLDLGCGSGWTSALLCELVAEREELTTSGEVIAIERIRELSEFCRENLKNAGYPQVDVYCSADLSATYGMENRSFDRILVSAACEEVPIALFEQLKSDGVMVIPVGHEIRKYHKSIDGNVEFKAFFGFSFVPLV